MQRAIDVARYFLSLCDPEEGELMSNLKLQKLLYYAQGLHYGVRGLPLFSENIEAWAHGPVVPIVYHEFRQYGSGEIPPKEAENDVKFSDEEREIVGEAFNVYGQFSAWRLSEMTHDEPPWRNTPQGAVITPRKMKEYFRTLVLTHGEDG